MRTYTVMAVQFNLTRLQWILAAGLVVVAAGGCQKPATPAEQPVERARTSVSAVVAEPLPAPVAATAASPRLTANGGRVIVSWLEMANFRSTLKFAERTSSGWTEPQ